MRESTNVSEHHADSPLGPLQILIAFEQESRDFESDVAAEDLLDVLLFPQSAHHAVKLVDKRAEFIGA